MGRKKKAGKPPAPPPPPPPVPRGRALRPVLTVGLGLLAIAAAALALAWLGDEALRRIGPRDRYRARLADVACDAPPATDRATFLAEVRYLGELPDAINALDAEDRDRLAAAFARHPWVERVEEVRAEPGPRLVARLTFRQPVLEVPTAPDGRRLVDAAGVLLPPCPTPDGLAVLAPPVPEPAVAAGKVWDDPAVARAVSLVDAYKPARLEKSGAGWKLTLRDGKTLSVN